MKFDQILSDTGTRAPAQPRYLEGTRDTGVLLVHGFTGFPDRVAYLGEQLNSAGYTVSIPRLPGHGVCGQDFASTGHREWLRAAADAWYDLRGRYSKVFIGGQSMGGVLATIVASRVAPAGLMLYAPAFTVQNRLIYLTPLLKWFVKRLAIPFDEKVDDPEEQFLLDDIGAYRWVPQTASLLALQRRAAKAIRTIRCPIMTVVSRKDNTVPVGVLETVRYRSASDDFSQLILDESSHIVADSVDRERVAAFTTEWLNAR